ncbi:MAG: hypothetical protein KF847_14405 [Pirellulales bacterium]|nr:hypothetical protein [Pirellulales bacterium]
MPYDAPTSSRDGRDARRPRSLARGLPAAVAALSLGCSGKPAAIAPVAISAGRAGEAAIAAYDRDGDGCLNDAELAAVPALALYKEKYDADNSGCISAGEIADRIASWRNQGVGLRTLAIDVLLDDRPLVGAEVRMIPEEYLGDGPQEATGRTDASGTAKMSVAPEHLPEAARQARMLGVLGGTYRIAVSHPRIKLPQRYVDGAALGDEIARDTIGDRIVLKLASR